MAHLLRVVLIAFAALAWFPANALIPAPKTVFHIDEYTGSTAQGVCSAAGEGSRSSNGGANFRTAPYVDSGPPMVCIWQYLIPNVGFNNGRFNITQDTSGSCPANSGIEGNFCVCNSGWKEEAGQCKVTTGGPSTATEFCKGMGDVKAPFKLTGTSTGSAPETSCYMPFPPFEGADAAKGCATRLGDSVAVPNPNGTRTWSATGIATGATCTDAPAVADGTSTQNPPPRAAENPCPSGFPGSVNGTSVCVPSVPDSGVGGVKTTETISPTGQKEINTETTECNGGTCSTTKTTKTYDSQGVLTNTVVGPTTKESIQSKCNSDPANKVCAAVGLGTGKNGTGAGNGTGGSGSGEAGPSSFGGDCAAGFRAVSDDAVINAMAMEQYKRNCQLFETDSEERRAYEDDKAKTKAGIDRTSELLSSSNKSMTIGPSDFDGSSAIAASSCITDKVISFQGTSITLPFSDLCKYLSYIGTLLTAVGYLMAARIVVRG